MKIFNIVPKFKLMEEYYETKLNMHKKFRDHIK